MLRKLSPHPHLYPHFWSPEAWVSGWWFRKSRAGLVGRLATHSHSFFCLSTPLESSPSPTPLCSWPTMVNSQGSDLRVAGDGSVFHTQLSSKKDLKLWNGMEMGEQGTPRNPILAWMSNHVLSATFLGYPVLHAIKLILYLLPICLSVSLWINIHGGDPTVFLLTIPPNSLVPWKMGDLAEHARSSFLLLSRWSDYHSPVLPVPELSDLRPVTKPPSLNNLEQEMRRFLSVLKSPHKLINMQIQEAVHILGS